MVSGGAELKQLQPATVVVVSLAVVVLIGIAIITQLKTSGTYTLTNLTYFSNASVNLTHLVNVLTPLVDNATADLFISGLIYFGTFLGVIVIGIVGKILIGMFKSTK